MAYGKTNAGGGKQPQLNAPTLALSNNYLLSLTDSDNGNFTTGYKLLGGNQDYVATATSVNVANVLGTTSGAVAYTITAQCQGNNFKTSLSSSSVSLDGLIAQYTASADGNISAQDFVKYVVATDLYSGTASTFNSARTNYISTSLIDATHCLVAYCDSGNSSYGTAQVLTISGTTITAGDGYLFNSASTYDISTSLIDSTHCLVAYRDDGNSNRGTAQILTISGTTITAGTEYVFNSALTGYISTLLIDATHCLVAYSDISNSSRGIAQVLTISGTTITAGSKNVFNSASTGYISTLLIDATHCLVAYSDSGNSDYGTAQILTTSGTTITAGSKNVFNSASTGYISTLPIDATHCLVAYRDSGNSNRGTAQILTISGTTITAGTASTFNSARTDYISTSLIDSTHCLVAYSDYGNSDYGTAQVLTISGTTITAGTEYVFNSALTGYISTLLIDATHYLVGYNNNNATGNAIILYVNATGEVYTVSDITTADGVALTSATSGNTLQVYSAS